VRKAIAEMQQLQKRMS